MTHTEHTSDFFQKWEKLPTPAPITDDERALVQIERELDAQRRAGPFWTGTKEQWMQFESQSGKMGEGFDAFEDASTYGRRSAKRSWRPADLSRIKLGTLFTLGLFHDEFADYL